MRDINKFDSRIQEPIFWQNIYKTGKTKMIIYFKMGGVLLLNCQ
jgi:hypothetical protein